MPMPVRAAERVSRRLRRCVVDPDYERGLDQHDGQRRVARRHLVLERDGEDDVPWVQVYGEHGEGEAGRHGNDNERPGPWRVAMITPRTAASTMATISVARSRVVSDSSHHDKCQPTDRSTTSWR